MSIDELVIGWRETLVALVILLALYVVFVVVRLRRLRAPAAVDAAAAEAAEPALAEATPQRVELDFPWNEPPEPAPPAEPDPGDEAEDPRLRAAEEAIRTLREDVSALAGEIAALREDMARRLESVQASHRVAPIYGDAMQLAAAGYDAATIAERCGVARAEAELVVALIRNRDNNGTMRER